MGRERDIFLRATARFGGPVPWDPLPDAAKAAYHEVEDRANDLIASARSALPKLPPIYFGFVYNAQVNAWAFRAQDQYFIGVTTGALYMLRLVVGRMLADPRIFPDIGDLSKEDPNLAPIADYRPDADAMYPTNSLLFPKDSVRKAYAWFLQDQAIMFFLGHEIAHITRGHVDYLREHRNASTTNEQLIDGLGASEALLERQCLEQDADRRSIISRIDSLRVTYCDDQFEGAPWCPTGMTAGDLIKDWSISLGILFQLFGNPHFSGADLRASAYPPLALRRLYAGSVSCWQVQHAWDTRLGPEAIKASQRAHFEAESAFATILGQPLTENALNEARSPAAMKHMMGLQDLWNAKMVDRLRPYSYEF